MSSPNIDMNKFDLQPVPPASTVEEENAAQAQFVVPAELFSNATVTICSIWPEALHSLPFSHGVNREGRLVGRRVYTLPPGSYEQPAYLRLYNTFTMILDHNSPPEQQPPLIPRTIAAGLLAKSLVEYWAGNKDTNPFGRIGIGIIKGQTATKEELDALNRTQRAYYRYLIQQAETRFQERKFRLIFASHRKAVERLGENPKRYAWCSIASADQTTPCPKCQEPLLATVRGCFKCGIDIADYLQSKGLPIRDQDWPTITADLVRAREAQAASESESESVSIQE